jgi:hypothetical protein
MKNRLTIKAAEEKSGEKVTAKVRAIVTSKPVTNQRNAPAARP